jgi:hypothetical protein
LKWDEYWNVRQAFIKSGQQSNPEDGGSTILRNINIVTDLIKALPSNSSVNSQTHTGGQQ